MNCFQVPSVTQWKRRTSIEMWQQLWIILMKQVISIPISFFQPWRYLWRWITLYWFKKYVEIYRAILYEIWELGEVRADSGLLLSETDSSTLNGGHVSWFIYTYTLSGFYISWYKWTLMFTNIYFDWVTQNYCNMISLILPSSWLVLSPYENGRWRYLCTQKYNCVLFFDSYLFWHFMKNEKVL